MDAIHIFPLSALLGPSQYQLIDTILIVPSLAPARMAAEYTRVLLRTFLITGKGSLFIHTP